MQQQDQLIAAVRSPAVGRLEVYVARWLPEEWEKDRRPPKVMWLQTNTYHYLLPEEARRFAEALQRAAEEAEG
jgi:hypothetical protein